MYFYSICVYQKYVKRVIIDITCLDAEPQMKRTQTTSDCMRHWYQEALLFSLIQDSQFRIRQILSDCGQFSEISGGVVLSGMDTAPSDYRKYFPTLQYLHCILSPDTYGHFAHVFSVQRLMCGVYIMWLVVVIQGGSSAAGFVETLLCIVNWKGWSGLDLFQVLILELLWKETYWRKLRYDISDDNHDTSQRRCRSDCARYKPLRGPGLDEILVPFL